MATGKSYLPAGEELEAFKREYPTASRERVEEMARSFGYKNGANLVTAASRMGIKRGWEYVKKSEEPETVVERVPYPDFKIKPFTVVKKGRDVEDMGIVWADWHTAKVTENYDIATNRARVDKLLDNTMTLINLHRPIRKLWVFELGDGVQGENPHQGSKIGDVECGAYEQIEEHAVPIRARFLSSISQGVEAVEYVGVAGNHGVYDKTATSRTNWDNFLYTSLGRALSGQKNIQVHTPKWFYQLVNIQGFRFFIIHGHQVTATAGIPLFAMRRKMQEWYAYLMGFNYAYAAHFHSGAYDQVNSAADYTISPPLVTGDSWALEKVGRASEPKQLCFGIHEKWGRTFRYDVHTDDRFLPRRYKEPEGVIEV